MDRRVLFFVVRLLILRVLRLIVGNTAASSVEVENAVLGHRAGGAPSEHEEAGAASAGSARCARSAPITC